MDKQGMFYFNANIASTAIQLMINSINDSDSETVQEILEILSPIFMEIEYAIELAEETIFNKGE